MPQLSATTAPFKVDAYPSGTIIPNKLTHLEAASAMVFYHRNRKASSLLQWELAKELCRWVCTGDCTAMREVWTLGLSKAACFVFPQFKLDRRDS